MKLIQNSGTPIYQQIAEQFKSDILEGRLEQSAYLPSIRSLAKELKISVITTMKAYEILEAEGLICAVPGKGFYVNAQDTEMLKEQHMRKVESNLLEAMKAARIAGLSKQELLDTFQTLMLLEEEF